ncbi:glycosyltransferase family A protein [Lonepinella koalarum]|uniref:glycosyltransferase family A protein n=1 Tax=Lonepinella koalarum TaxID=53417 RepID=UPI001E4F7EE2|nr:glycosyltransferase family A protein [Lonepinella koalarum]
MATYGRKNEISEFLDSLLLQEYDISMIEIIIVDQNDKIDLSEIVANYSGKLNIKHIISDKKGLSINRNIGLEYATGEYVAFPDDDCTYYPDTLSNTIRLFNDEKDVDVFLGRIYDRKTLQNIIRNWKELSFKITKNNFFLHYSSITIFHRANKVRFDNELGVGQFFGSCEDTDYVWQLLNQRLQVKYTPDIVVWHPELNKNVMNYNKIYSYGLGFGAYIYKNRSLENLFLLIKVLGFHCIKLMLSVFKLDKVGIKKSWLSIKSRLLGIYLYAIK